MMVVDSSGLALVPWDKVAHAFVKGASWFFKFFIAVGGSIPYVFQYSEIYHKKNAQGFSLFVCLALCVANIMRIFFWFGKHFDNALLAQSIIMLICMVFMLEISVRMNRKHTPKPQWKSVLTGHFISAFWAWHNLLSFMIPLAAFTAFWAILTAIFVDYSWYVETIGMIALLVEAALGAPQLIRNFLRKSTTGMSIPMVLAWLCGDLAKTGYFVVENSPTQFWICAILQITIDILILGQVYLYRKNSGPADLPYSSGSPPHSTLD